MPEPSIPRFTLQGVTDAAISEHPFSTEDALGLTLTRYLRAESDDVVLLIHGLTLSRDMFIMPEHVNLVSYLLDNGFPDVFTVDFRMSNRYPYDTETHAYTLDDVACLDHPAALERLRDIVGPDRRIHVIAHCLGSVSFMMSLFGGKVEQPASLIANSVGLTPRVPGWAKWKLRFGPGLSEYVLGLPILDPRYGAAPWFTRRRMLAGGVSLLHRECPDSACHMLSFMWGSGKPAMFSHEQIHESTHARMGTLCGPVGVSYYRHVHAMAEAGLAIAHDPARLPADPFANAAAITTPILFTTGDRNHVFTDSNIVCHRRLEELAPGRHELEILPGYGHVDPFMGVRSHLEVFPKMLAFLKRHAGSGSDS